MRFEKNNREKQQQHGEISDILVTILAPYFLTDFCPKRFAFVHFRSSLLRIADFSSDRITKANSRQCETSRIRLDFHWTIFPHDRWTFFSTKERKKKKNRAICLLFSFYLRNSIMRVLNKWIRHSTRFTCSIHLENISLYLIFVRRSIRIGGKKIIIKIIQNIAWNGVRVWLTQEIKRDNWNIFDHQPWFIIKFSFV